MELLTSLSNLAELSILGGAALWSVENAIRRWCE